MGAKRPGKTRLLAAQAAPRKDRPRLVFLDVNTPGKKGSDAAAELVLHFLVRAEGELKCVISNLSRELQLHTTHMKILIAEDDVISRKVLRLTLEQLGHEVLAAGDGAEAWDIFDREPVRVVVSDWMMPNLNGLDLCKRIRARPQTPYTYFIILTAAHTTSDDFSFAMDSGIDDFLAKPLDREMLRTRLHVAQRILRDTAEIGLLQDLLPMCAFCHKIRDGADYWERVDTYIKAKTGACFSRGVCPECYEKQVTILVKTIAENRGLSAGRLSQFTP